MPTAKEILAARKETTFQRFLKQIRKKDVLPDGTPIPSSPEEALKLGMKLGRQRGYSDGLVDGTELGLDVGLEAVDALLRQPVIFAEGGTA